MLDLYLLPHLWGVRSATLAPPPTSAWTIVGGGMFAALVLVGLLRSRLVSALGTSSVGLLWLRLVSALGASSVGVIRSRPVSAPGAYSVGVIRPRLVGDGAYSVRMFRRSPV